MKNKILVTGGDGRFAKVLKKNNKYLNLFFASKKQCNILNLNSIIYNLHCPHLGGKSLTEIDRLALFPHLQTCPTTRAGFPKTSSYGATSLVTTLPAPTIQYSPKVTPHTNVAFAPTEAPFLRCVLVILKS
mgnify:CR=1 FL=1